MLGLISLLELFHMGLRYLHFFLLFYGVQAKEVKLIKGTIHENTTCSRCRLPESAIIHSQHSEINKVMVNYLHVHLINKRRSRLLIQQIKRETEEISIYRSRHASRSSAKKRPSTRTRSPWKRRSAGGNKRQKAEYRRFQ